MSRIILNIDKGVSDAEALQKVMRVVGEGKVSGNGKQYCYHTVFGSGVEVSCFRTLTGTMSFNVRRKK